LTLAAKTLTDTGFTVTNKTYDGTTAATITADGSLVGVVAGDTVSLNNGGASATFDNKNVGTTHTITAAGYALSGPQAGDYTLPQPTASNVTISAKALTVTGMTASNKTYDGTTAATVNNSGDSLVGVIGGDVVSLSGTGSTAGVFDNKNVGTTHTVTAAGVTLAGADAGNYSLTVPTASNVSIFAKPLTVTATDRSKHVGASDPVLTYSYSGLAASDTSAPFTGVLGRDTGESPGNYAIRAGTLAGTGNYTIGTFNDGNFTITAFTGTSTTLPATVQGVSGEASLKSSPSPPSASGLSIDADVGILAPEEWSLKPQQPGRWWNRITARWDK
jgi:hypothetical protein